MRLAKVLRTASMSAVSDHHVPDPMAPDPVPDGTGGDAAQSPPVNDVAAVFYDGNSNRKRRVALQFNAQLDIVEDGSVIASWPYADIRQVDSTRAMRLSCGVGAGAGAAGDRGQGHRPIASPRCVLRSTPRNPASRPAASLPGRWRRRVRSFSSRCSAFR